MDPRRIATWAVVAGGALGWCVLMARLLQVSYDTAMGVVLFHVVGGLGAMLTWAIARRTENRAIVQIIVAGWFAKLVGTLVRFYVLQVVYDGTGDANRYSSVGANVAEMFRSGQVAWHRPGDKVVGTHFLEFVTGLIFTVTGPTTLGGFVVFSMLGFVGTFLIFRAVRIAAPEVDSRLFAVLLFFLPSMVFWPSSIGKETVMVLAIGLFTYGAARLFARMGGGLLALGAGAALSGMIRPHITLMLVAALLLATVIARPVGATDEIPLGKVLKVGVAIALLVWAASSAASFLDVDPLDSTAVGQALESTGEQTDEGGSAFSNVNPVFLPLALVTVLFRPFPFEAGNLQATIASFEGILLLGLVVRRRHAVWMAIRRLRSSPMLTVAVVYILVFVYAYTGINNFGILARQRAQVYPFVVMLLAVATHTVGRAVPDPTREPATATPVTAGSHRPAPSPRRGQALDALRIKR